MLKLKHLFENFALDKEALTHWSYDEESLDKALRRFRISSNAMYPFFRDGELCFLRLAPTEEKLKQNILGELEFIQYLRSHNFPALEPIPAQNGQLLLELDTAWGCYYAAAFKKVSGTPIEDTNLSASILYEYGKTLGRLHTLSADFAPQTAKWSYDEALDWSAQVLAKYYAPDYMTRKLQKIRQELALLPQNVQTYGLVHYDFEPDNVFYDSLTNTCSVIDFDDGMYHWYALDLQQVFDALPPDASKDEFLRGYQTEHDYTAEMAASLPLMQRFVNLFGYARLLHCVSDPVENEPDWMKQLRKRLGNALKQKEHFVQLH
ncbi:MAG: phosphotransferase [Firmicutes bacterium]|nr:phosphotransferase [Bacillota bacterium]